MEARGILETLNLPGEDNAKIIKTAGTLFIFFISIVAHPFSFYEL